MPKTEPENSGILHSVMEQLNNPILTMAVFIGSAQLIRKLIDLSEPKNIFYARIAYVTSQVLMIGALLLLRYFIRMSEDGPRVNVDHPANPLTGEPARKQAMTTREYDLSEVGKQLQSTVIGFGFMLLLHKWFGLVQPLVVQSVMPWKSFFTSPLIRIRLFGQYASGSLARPFKAAEGPLAQLMKNIQEGVAAQPANAAESEFDVPPTIEPEPSETSSARQRPGRKED